jgi:3-isopropylmalate dehydrogenase
VAESICLVSFPKPANEVFVNTASGVERVFRYAFEALGARGKKLALVHKTKVLTHGGAL